jgi:hypothetical protein
MKLNAGKFSFFTSTLFVCCIVLFFSWTTITKAQTAVVSGNVKDSSGVPLAGVNIAILGSATGTTTSDNGIYSLEVPAEKNLVVVFSYVGRPTEKFKIFLKEGQKYDLNYTMKSTITRLKDVVIQEEQHRIGAMKKLDPKLVTLMPNASGNFEGILKTLPGVVSNNELSSQYSVRGGNYDENLVYVNDVEIYRPFLVRSGQQEGLIWCHRLCFQQGALMRGMVIKCRLCSMLLIKGLQNLAQRPE